MRFLAVLVGCQYGVGGMLSVAVCGVLRSCWQCWKVDSKVLVWCCKVVGRMVMGYCEVVGMVLEGSQWGLMGCCEVVRGRGLKFRGKLDVKI